MMHDALLSYALNLFCQTEEKEQSVWASALSCLLYFVCDRGKILRNRLEGLDIRVSLYFFPSSTTSGYYHENATFLPSLSG
jgi:hypothetical protein